MNMKSLITGMHHITALASDPGKNYDFYTRVLGLRLVKQTVNFDAPDVYHLYFGDTIGSPGTILTFFPFPMARRGRRGVGETQNVTFAIPTGSMGFWQERLKVLAIPYSRMAIFGHDRLIFQDLDGLQLALEENAMDNADAWTTADIPHNAAIRRMLGINAVVRESRPSVDLLTDHLEFRVDNSEGAVLRLKIGQNETAFYYDVIEDKTGVAARQSAGSIHHIAWRTPDDSHHAIIRETLVNHGIMPTEFIDRNYFHSIYFREPGGVLYEVATDNPGFMVDESREELGSELQLPAQYESRRESIRNILPPLFQTTDTTELAR
jgi:glyoxalase family protein